MPKLTKRTVDAATPDVRDRFIWDDEVKGFGLKITPAGRKVFVFQYRIGGRAGRTQRVKLGDFGALTPEEARRLAIKLRGEVAKGESPADARSARKRAIREARDAATVEQLADEFLTDRRAKKKAGTVAEYERFLRKDVLPVLGRLKVADVTRAQIAKLHLSMKDRPVLANRVLAVLGAMFNFAELFEHRPRGSNPCADIGFYPEEPRERFLSAEEFARLGDALRRAESEGLPTPPKLRRKPKVGPTAKHRPRTADVPRPANPVAVAALRFLLLTGWREGEALGLRWDEIDFSRGIATLPTTKTGRSARHLGAPALMLVSELPRVEGSVYVFPGAKPGTHLQDFKRLWEAVRHAAELHDVRLHDLRHSFASAGVADGLSLPVLGALLGHREVATTQRYAHLGDDPRKRAADQVAASVAAALAAGAAKTSEPPATVLPFAARA